MKIKHHQQQHKLINKLKAADIAGGGDDHIEEAAAAAAAAMDDGGSAGFRKGPWTEQEDMKLEWFVRLFGERRWDFLAKVSGLNRTGKSCRLRWVNYLHPDLKRGRMTPDEERRVVDLQAAFGNRWSRIAKSMPGRTDNEIKNYWRTHMRKQRNTTTATSSSSTSAASTTTNSNSTSSTTSTAPAAASPETCTSTSSTSSSSSNNNNNNNNNNNVDEAPSQEEQILYTAAGAGMVVDQLLIWNDGMDWSSCATMAAASLVPSSPVWDVDYCSASLWE